MRIVVQRVKQAQVEVDGKIVGSIGPGILVFIGITHKDSENEAVWLANKVVNLRIFEDDLGKMNKSLLECGGEALLVSQFTLYGDCSQGRRPSFTEAASPEKGKELCEKFADEVRKRGVNVETGVFGADMKVLLLNDGPVTFIIDK